MRSYVFLVTNSRRKVFFISIYAAINTNHDNILPSITIDYIMFKLLIVNSFPNIIQVGVCPVVS